MSADEQGNTPITRIEQYHINGRYTVTYERSATKGTDGFKVTANGDERSVVESDAMKLYLEARFRTEPQFTIGGTADGAKLG